MSGTKPILVTGATGFVGSHLVRALLARGERVRALGRSETALAELAKGGAETVRVDLRDRDAVFAACRGARVVYHVGAVSSDWGARAEFEAVNVGGTETVIDGCRLANVERLVYVSSPSVLFDGHDQTDLPDDAPYPTRFVSVYSETKKRGEDLVNAARQELPCVIVRPKAVFGPGDTSLLPRLVAATRARRLPQIGNGENRVDLTYIDNVVHALLLAGTAPGAVRNTYNLTNGEPARPLWEVIGTVLMGLGVPLPARRMSVQTALAVAGLLELKARITGTPPLLSRYSVLILARTQTYDIRRARKQLEYAPIVPLDEGIAKTIEAWNARD